MRERSREIGAPTARQQDHRGRPPRRPPRLVIALLVALTVALPACARACKSDRPYVPYAIGDAAAPAAPSATMAAEAPDAAVETGLDASRAEPALVAPLDARTWSTSGVTLEAPPDRVFVSGIVADFDEDATSDALVVVRPPAADAGSAADEILFYGGGQAPRTVVTGPPLPALGSCERSARLERLSARTAFVELGYTCARDAGARILSLVRLGRETKAAFHVGVADPLGAPRLLVDADGGDRDADGIDDIALRLTIEGGAPPFEPGPRLSAKLAFFDRPAGPSRDADEPEASLRAIAGDLVARAGRPADAPRVPVMVQQMRSLFRAMCQEGGAPRVVNVRSAAPIACGPSRPLEDAGLAEVRAFVAQGDVLRALAAARDAQSPPATRTAAKTAEIDKLLSKLAPYATPRSTRTLGLMTPAARGRHPEWGPLAFEPDGKLLVRTSARVARVDVETGVEEATDVTPWNLQVVSPDGASRWLEAYHACEGVALRATFVPTGEEADVRDVLLPIAPALGKRCEAGRGEAADTVPLAWSARGLEALVAGQPLLLRPENGSAVLLSATLDERASLGSPRSPSGRNIAIPTRDAVLVRSERAARLRAPAFEPYSELRHCTASNDATSVACSTRRGQVVIARLDIP